MSVLTITSGSKQILVDIPLHGALDGDYVNFDGITTSLGGIPASELNGDHLISNVTLNTFTIEVATTATSNATYDNPLTVVFDIHSGFNINNLGYGWGAGSWGRESWGLGAKEPIVQLARIYTQDRFNNDLIFCIRGGEYFENVYHRTQRYRNGAG